MNFSLGCFQSRYIPSDIINCIVTSYSSFFDIHVQSDARGAQGGAISATLQMLYVELGRSLFSRCSLSGASGQTNLYGGAVYVAANVLLTDSICADFCYSYHGQFLYCNSSSTTSSTQINRTSLLDCGQVSTKCYGTLQLGCGFPMTLTESNWTSCSAYTGFGTAIYSGMSIRSHLDSFSVDYATVISCSGNIIIYDSGEISRSIVSKSNFVNNTGQGNWPSVFYGSLRGFELTDVVFRGNSCPPIDLSIISPSYDFILLRCVFDQAVETRFYTIVSGDNLTVTGWAPTITITEYDHVFCTVCATPTIPPTGSLKRTFCTTLDGCYFIGYQPPSEINCIIITDSCFVAIHISNSGATGAAISATSQIVSVSCTRSFF
jgi:hypothetical protein